MKKIYLLFFFLAPAFFAISQTKLSEEFESTVFPSEGWTLINGNDPVGYNWSLNSDPALAYVNSTNDPYPALEGQGSMVYETDTSNNANAWAITPAVRLASGVPYNISFYYRVAKADYPEKMKVTVGNNATIQDQSTVLWDNNGDTGLTNETTWTRASIKYTPTTSADFYFGFNCYSDANAAALVIDNIKIEVAPTVAPPCARLTYPADGATEVTAPQALFTWDSAGTASEYIFKLNKTNNPDSIGFSVDQMAYRSGLEYNTTYYWSIVPKNIIGAAAGCPVYSFTTQAAPPVPTNDECAGAIEIKPGSTITGSTKSATESMPAESCDGSVGNANDDVWFKYTPTQSGAATITLTPDLIFDGVVNVYSGDCGSLVSLTCADQGFDGGSEIVTLPDLTAGQTYYFRVYGYGKSDVDGSFTLTASGTTLPVTITGFKGKQDGLQNILSWTTLTEQNNKGFELQRATNGRDFSTIAFMATKSVNGYSTAALSYTFTDAKPVAEKSYYRLRQVDKDGRKTISNIVLLKGAHANTFALSNIYPNPAKSSINVVVNAPATTSTYITITDLAGKPVMQQSAKLAAGENNLSLNVNSLPSGNYIIKAVSGDSKQTAIGKFVKQ